MSRPVPTAQYRHTDYSLRYQVILDHLNNAGIAPPIGVGPSRGKHAKGSFVINTTDSNWKDRGLGRNIARPIYSRRRKALGFQQQRVRHAQNKAELAAMTKVVSTRDSKSKGESRRSQSEPSHFPPIDEASLAYLGLPGRQDQLGSPPYDLVAKKEASINMKNRAQMPTRPGSTVTEMLPSLSKLSEEKSQFVDGAFLKGVQRHHQAAPASHGRALRLPRQSWIGNEARTRRVLLTRPEKPREIRPDQGAANTNGCLHSVRLRDMDLTFSVKNKMEKLRQWHKDQFMNYLKQWKVGGNLEKKTEALKLLASYKEKELQLNGAPTPNDSGLEKEIKVQKDKISNSQENKTDEQMIKEEATSPGRTLCNLETGGTENNNDDEIKEKPANFCKSWRANDDACAYEDVGKYIEENNLMPLSKCQRISEWLNSVDITSDESLSLSDDENSSVSEDLDVISSTS